MLPREHLDALAHTHGFHVSRAAPITGGPRADGFTRWLARGRHADMGWLSRTRAVRVDPRQRAPWAKTALVLSICYAHQRPPRPSGRVGRVARYAWGRDYHNLMGKRLKRLTAALRDAGVRAWGGVDSAPILERDWAKRAGLGFTGKHTLQILPGSTSWMFLAVVFIDQDTVTDQPVTRDHCGSCQRCLVACPTDAFAAPYDLDASKCISYWTIEAKTMPPESLRLQFGDWVFGCDVCQEVCPHNHAPPQASEPDLEPRHAWLDLDDLLAATDEQLMSRFIGTPLRRPGAAGLKRNALIALANLGDSDAIENIERHAMRHTSALVREAAHWARGVLSAPAKAPQRRPRA